jgi:2-amino-4-hydroxy-6-hydroxymethyldihydropteridine diphosphokinase
LGNRQANLKSALNELRALPTIRVAQVSSLYETAAVGITEQPDFLNAAAEIQTSLAPGELLGVLLHIENKMGRVRTFRWGPRVIDLDLLLYEAQQISLPGLIVPHPRLRERAFVVIPLAEIAPGLALPEDGKNISEIADFFFRKGNIQRRGVV